MAERVRELRERAGWTQTQFARIAGVSPAYIQRLEAGDFQNPSFKYLSKLARAFGVSLEVLTGADPMQPPDVDPITELLDEVDRDYFKGRVSPEDRRNGEKLVRGFYKLGEREQEHFLNQLELLLLIRHPHPPSPPPDTAAGEG